MQPPHRPSAPASSQPVPLPQGPPYPEQVSPYPAQVSSYPALVTSYPAQVSPYPAQGSPYPGQGSPYRAQGSPYPAQGSPYPAPPSTPPPLPFDIVPSAEREGFERKRSGGGAGGMDGGGGGGGGGGAGRGAGGGEEMLLDSVLLIPCSNRGDSGGSSVLNQGVFSHSVSGAGVDRNPSANQQQHNGHSQQQHQQHHHHQQQQQQQQQHQAHQQQQQQQQQAHQQQQSQAYWRQSAGVSSGAAIVPGAVAAVPAAMPAAVPAALTFRALPPKDLAAAASHLPRPAPKGPGSSSVCVPRVESSSHQRASLAPVDPFLPLLPLLPLLPHLQLTFRALPPRDLAAAACVCREWRAAATSEPLWPLDLAAAACVCREWRAAAISEPLWHRHTIALWPALASPAVARRVSDSCGFYLFYSPAVARRVSDSCGFYLFYRLVALSISLSATATPSLSGQRSPAVGRSLPLWPALVSPAVACRVSDSCGFYLFYRTGLPAPLPFHLDDLTFFSLFSPSFCGRASPLPFHLDDLTFFFDLSFHGSPVFSQAFKYKGGRALVPFSPSFHPQPNPIFPPPFSPLFALFHFPPPSPSPHPLPLSGSVSSPFPPERQCGAGC
ncbi:unnamed protein product [Closterium sp. Naga37s-1]|nr:unnamed protein product [Closterium sp. Naga37s-1]